MVQTPPTSMLIDDLRSAVREVCEPRHVTKVELFGSHATGRAHAGSDVDLLIEFGPESRAGLFEMGEIKELLEEKLGCSVDLISRSAVERSTNPYRRRLMLQDAVAIYER